MGHFYYKLNIPTSQEDGLFTWSRAFGFFFQTHDVGQGGYSGGDVPGQTQQGTDQHADTHNEHVQVVTVSFLFKNDLKKMLYTKQTFESRYII